MNFMNPLTLNKFSIKDIFHPVSEINNLLPISFMRVVELTILTLNPSLLNRINIIKSKLRTKPVPTIMTKRILKKLILESCTNITLPFNGKYLNQTFGISKLTFFGPTKADFKNVLLSCPFSFVKETVAIDTWMKL